MTGYSRDFSISGGEKLNESYLRGTCVNTPGCCFSVFYSCQEEEIPVIQPEVAVDLNESSTFDIIQQPPSSVEKERLRKNLGLQILSHWGCW